MAEQQGSWFENAGEVNHADELRRVVNALLSGQGVAHAGELAVTAQGTPNMSVQVAAGHVFIKGTAATGQGTYHGYNDAAVTKTLAAADPANPRHDLVIAEVLDTAYGSASDTWQLRVVTGTPNSDPQDPAVTGNVGYVILARVTVRAGTSSIVGGDIDLSVRPWATSVGSALQMLGIGTALAGTPPTSPQGGTFFWQGGRFNGTTDASGHMRVTFPVPFPNGLLCYMAFNADDAWGQYVTGGEISVWGSGSNTDFVVKAYKADGTVRVNLTTRVNWIAIGW